jgi:hypothetical protein
MDWLVPEFLSHALREIFNQLSPSGLAAAKATGKRLGRPLVFADGPRIAALRAQAHISILNFTYKPLDARFHLCLCKFERDEGGLEVETRWVRARTGHFSYRSTVR